MAKPVTTRTIGPLHPEDLEPKRFEDLVRQLAYDFRIWRKLEATGRGGGDEGFDARGYEIVGAQGPEVASADGEEEVEGEDAQRDRLWMVQCKREKSIGPAKLRKYLESIIVSDDEPIHGFIFAAACNFTMASHKVFFEVVRKKGIAEAYLWGSGELEDQLFQPKNDGLLFAYYGISLQTRKRSLKTEIRTKLATKRKCKKVLHPYDDVLIRDVADSRYPYLDISRPDRVSQGHWKVYRIEDCASDGVRVLRHRHLAFLDVETGEWDYAERMNDGPVHHSTDPWSERDRYDAPDRQSASSVWNALPPNHKGWLEMYLVLPYENILAVDEDGDEHFTRPHVYTPPWDGVSFPFANYSIFQLEGIEPESRRGIRPIQHKRIKKFARGIGKRSQYFDGIEDDPENAGAT
ncbi:MAG: hypothetical protein V7651_04675 [Hyphomonas oceanitis]|uniref:hypothetical protein n=1 Tax=Hyphomonas oceanitis TaxID=81033 RepID=UPI0030011DEB